MEEVLAVGKEIGLILAEVIIALAVCSQYVKKYFKKPDIGKLVPGQNVIDLEITNKMDYVKEILNADRIHIYEFHNGEHYSDYRSACKFSCSYEVVRAGKPSVQKDCTSLPISVMPKFIRNVTVDGLFYCEDIESLKTEMPSTYRFKENLGIKSFYDIAIKNESGCTIGFIAIHWDKGTVPNINEEEIHRLVWFVEERIARAVKLVNKR